MSEPPPLDPRAKAAFLAALELDAAERTRFLEQLADPTLAQVVETLLMAHDSRPAGELEDMPRALRRALGPVAAPGVRLGDHELLEEIGAGAFGSVWRARQVSLDRIVALKLLRQGRLAGHKEQERLRAEAEAAARLDHPGIVPIHEVGELDGVAFFSMKWIEGGSLAEQLSTPWPPRRAAMLMVAVARAMHHAHQRGVLHRDLKPSNVLLDAQGRPHVADFGIARRLDRSPTDRSTGALVGTPAYMAPEQADGRELTVATDIWALGCILYELLAARSAFQAETLAATLERVRTQEPAPLADLRQQVPRDLATIVQACLRKDPGSRYASADALAEDLERWLNHEPIAARRTGAWERVQLFCRRSPLASTLIGIVTALLVLLAAVATWSSVALGQRMRDAYLGQARATRLSGVPGARSAALDLLDRAAAVRGGEDLRAEAIACSALSDLALLHTVPRPAGRDHRAWTDRALTRVVLSTAGGLVVVDARTGDRVAELRSDTEAAWARWSADGRWLLEKSAHPSPPSRWMFRVWDMTRYAEALQRDVEIVNSEADFDPTRPRLVYVDRSGELVSLDLETGVDLERRPLGLQPDQSCWDLACRPDGEAVALAVRGPRPQVQVRSVADGTLQLAIDLDSDPLRVTWLGSAEAFAVGCEDGRVLVFDGPAAPRHVLIGHAAEVVDLIPGAHGALLATSSWDETTRLWDLLTGRAVRVLSARALGFDVRGATFASLDARGWSLWRVEHHDVLRATHAHVGKSPWGLAFLGDAATLASAGQDGIRVWQADGALPPRRVAELNGRAVAHLPGTKVLFAGGVDGLLRVDLGSAAPPARVHPGPCHGLLTTADGKTLLSLEQTQVRRFRVAPFTELEPLTGGAGMRFLTASADGSHVAAGSIRSGECFLWHAASTGAPRVLRRPSSQVSVALSPDGALFALSTNEAFELLRSDDLAQLVRIERHRAYGALPGPIAFSHDGRRVAFALAADVVRVLDLPSLAPVGDLVSPDPISLVHLEFAPGDAHLGAASRTNLLQVWDLAALARATDRWR